MSINESADNIGVIGLIHQGDNFLAHYDALELNETLKETYAVSN